MRESARRATAFHEAGHVVAAWCTGLKQKTATIVPTADAGGSAETRSVRGVTLGVISSARADLESLLKIRAAEMRIYRLASFFPGSP
jgi:ATP-dependent Zn protease